MSTAEPTVLNWQDEALTAFKVSLDDRLDPEDVGGKYGRNFASGLPGVDAACLPAGQVKRSMIFLLASDTCVETVTVAAAVMAWGGMHMSFRNMLFTSPDTRWLEIATRFRSGEIDRQTAYAQLRTLRVEGSLKGTGPAYFTKLIYFLTPRGRKKAAQGYIMDQWAGCSVNLLLGREVVLMNVSRSHQISKRGHEVSSTFTVSDCNSEQNYEDFCRAIDVLAEQLKLSADQIDRALIANGGRKPSQWRKYLIQNRSIPTFNAKPNL
ncbi:MAG: hypothetical protein KDA67_01985 [Rhodobacteraceae bacterium]|nr:hypothetical protein [Paracoccaceae bacterium]